MGLNLRNMFLVSDSGNAGPSDCRAGAPIFSARLRLTEYSPNN